MEFRSLSVILWLIVLIHYGQTQDLLKPTLTVEPESHVFTGESVTLRCEISTHDGWTYQWYKQNKQSGWTAVSQSVYHTVNRDTLIIREDAVIHGDQYRCRAERHDRPTSSQYSDFVTLTIKALPRATLYTVKPESPVFTGGSFTLKCEINTHDGWTFQWYKQDKQHRLTAVSQSEYHTVNRDTLTIREDAVIHGDQHLCRGERHDRPKLSQYSNSVALPVKALPRATLTVEPKQTPVFAGESVTLKCEIESYSNWRYQWYKGNSSNAVFQSQTNTFTIRSADHYQDQYWCKGERDNRPASSQPSNTVTVTVKGEAKAVLSIKPDKHVFRGEAVTLRCDIEWERDTEWKYSWFKDTNPLYSSSTTQEFRFSPATESHSGKYTCSGEDIGNSGYSQTSDAVTLTVTGLPRATLTVKPEGPVFSGESVTLKCEIQSYSNWRYQWYKGSSRTAVNQSQTNTFTIRSAADQDQDQYWCKGERDNRPTTSQLSNPFNLTVKDTCPAVSLSISPSRTQHFITDSLSLSCEGQSDSTGWRVTRYTHSEKVSDCSSGWGSVTGSTCSISSLNTSHTGVYWCESESGENGNPVNITVTNGDVIMDSPVHPVTEGDPLTLRCLYHHTKLSNLIAEFHKDGSLLQTQTTGEMTIHTVSKSDEGLYHCKHPEKGESPQSWISVKGLSRSGASFSVFSLLSSVMAASPYLLVSIILGLKCYKARAKPEETNRTEAATEAGESC